MPNHNSTSVNDINVIIDEKLTWGVLSLIIHYYKHSQNIDSTAVLEPTALYTDTPILYGRPSVTVRACGPEQNSCGGNFTGDDPLTDVS